jgi:hypothetical protein
MRRVLALAVVGTAAGAFSGLFGVGGVLAGTALQQRIPTRAIAGGFALFLAASALVLLL